MNEQQVEFDQFQKDIEYSETHREELLNQYPEQWVAVLKGKVVGHTPDVYQLLDELRERGVPTERVVLRHLTRQEELFVTQ